MCGIAGIVNYPQIDNLEEQIHNMQAALRHRGPDDAGVYLSNDRATALAHTRLSILDLSSAGHQPMSASDGRYHITFNGEIYNFQELRADLVAQGEKFHSHTDTEVILKLYQRQGADCVDRLRGMFAFAIWDDLEKTCFLARDPLGIKPLYYARLGATLIFASEVKAILAARLFPVQMSAIGLSGYLTTGTVPEPYTIVEGVCCLPAGHWLKWEAGEVKQHQYWEIKFGNEPISESDAWEQVRQVLIDSISHHFISDVPVGIFLSGGIDSTALVALSRHTQSADLHTYSIAFVEPEWNEGSIAQKTAEHFGTQHHELCITPAIAKQIFPKFLTFLDQPTIDGFNTFCVSQLAREYGSKVVLSGLGGDEIFGGYKSFQQVPKLVKYGQILHSYKPIAQLIGQGLTSWSPQPQFKRLGEYLQRSPNTTNAMEAMRGIFTRSEAEIIAQKYLAPDTPFSTYIPNAIAPFPSLEDEVSVLELSGYMRNQLLHDSDVMSMAWGLELRVPFVDRVLLETVANIPSKLRLATGKQILIDAIPELPTWVTERPKRGFTFPFQKWFESDEDWNNYLPAVKSPPQVSIDLWYRRWSLMILDYWWQQNVR